MMDKERLLHRFVYDTFDVQNTRILDTFVENQTVKFGLMITHPLLKCNVMFCQVWFSCFGNFPTKKDFEEFIDIIGGVDNLLTNTNACVSPQNIAHGISKHDAFIVVRISPNAQRILTETCKKLNPDKFNVDVCGKLLVDKWLHRYTADVKFEPTDNLLQKYVKIYIDYSKRTKHIDPLILSKKQLPLRFHHVMDNLSFDSYTSMTHTERMQYTTHKNNRFLIHMLNAYFILSQSPHIPDYIQDCLEATFNCKVYVIYIGDFKHDNIPSNCYTLTKEEFQVLPKVFQNVCCINTEEFVEAYIAPSSTKNIYIHLGEIPIRTSLRFKFVVTQDATKVDPLQNIYFLPSNLSNDMKCYLLSNYFKFQSPFKTSTYEDNALLYNHFLATYMSLKGYNLLSLSAKCDSETKYSKSNVVLSVDSRFNIATYYAVVLSYCNLNKYSDDWGMTIFTRDENIAKYQQYNERYGFDLRCQSLDVLNDTKHFNIETYNSILKSQHFWEQLKENGYNKCLVVQDDGFLVNGERINEYMQFSYVGAPWADVPGNSYIKNNINNELVGNGGFSLRDINSMITVCSKYCHEKNELFFNNLNEIPEDVYFVKCLILDKRSIASHNEAQYFSIEQVVPSTDIKKLVGFHKFWMYNSPATVWNVFKMFLETA
jgi:hypothetical protein